MTAPRVSVILPAYNGERYLAQAVNSILRQTFTDFELVVVDDCSTDSTPYLLTAIRDPRLRVLRHECNQGVANALNTGWQYAQAALIAIMHADDISLPTRLEKQVAFLDQHPEVGILGCRIDMIDQNGHFIGRRYDMLSQPVLASWELHFYNTLAHPTVMMRRTVLEAVNGYQPDMRSEEDYDLWSRATSITGLMSLPDVLLQYRTWPLSLSMRGPEQMEQRSILIVQRLVSQTLGADISLEDAAHLRRLARVGGGRNPQTPAQIDRTATLLKLLYDAYTARSVLDAADHAAVTESAALKLILLANLARSVDKPLAARLIARALLLKPTVALTAGQEFYKKMIKAYL